MKLNLQKSRGWILLYYFLISFVLLCVCTRSSFLYPMNNWDDSNSYFTMGKSMFHGIVIYRDIFDQKGPYLYFLYGLCSLVSRTTFRGVFVMEVLLGMLDLFFAVRILRLYLKEETALIAAPVVFALSFSSFSFYWGGCAEEICLPSILWVLYLILRQIREKPGRPFAFRTVLTAGLLCGFAACVKFTLLGFFFGFMVIVLVRSGGVRRFLQSCGVFLLGMVLPAVPWLLYFGVHHALYDWYYAYVYENVFVYSNLGGQGAPAEGGRLYSMAKILYWLFFDNFQYFALIAAGFGYFLLRPQAGLLSRITLPLLFVLTFAGIYAGGTHLPYYSLPFTAFAVPGMVPAGLAAQWCVHRFAPAASGNNHPADCSDSHPAAAGSGSSFQRTPAAVCCAASLAASLCLVLLLSGNTYYLHYSKDDVFLTRFAQDIREYGSSNPTLLNYYCLDCGLYTAADIYPTCYWFQTQTLPDQRAYKEQEQYIAEGKTEFLVARDTYPDCTGDHYTLLDSFHQVMGETEHDYYLFRRIR